MLGFGEWLCEEKPSYDLIYMTVTSMQLMYFSSQINCGNMLYTADV